MTPATCDSTTETSTSTILFNRRSVFSISIRSIDRLVASGSFSMVA